MKEIPNFCGFLYFFHQMFRKWKEDKDAEIREQERKKKRQQERELRDKQDKEAEKRKDNEHAFRGWYDLVVKKLQIMDSRILDLR